MESIITQVSRDDDIGTQQAKQQACERKRPARSKPRWGRLVYSLCCCIAPDADREKQANGARSNPTLLIATHKGQQHINSSGPVVANTYAVDGRLHNEYMPTPTVAVPVAIGSNESKAPHKETLASGSGKWLLPQVRPADANKKCLIIDLDETLVHSSFKPVKNPDFVIPVEIDGVVHQVYVLKRPYVDDFLARVGERFECVLFTASLAKYADPVADLLDKRGVFRARLFREACVYHRGNYVKDLSRLGRDLRRVVIIDNSPASYVFHPDNAVPVHTWFDDPTDSELLEILPVLEKIERLDSVYDAIGAGEEDNYRSSNNGQPTRVSVHESLLGVQPA